MVPNIASENPVRAAQPPENPLGFSFGFIYFEQDSNSSHDQQFSFLSNLLPHLKCPHIPVPALRGSGENK